MRLSSVNEVLWLKGFEFNNYIIIIEWCTIDSIKYLVPINSNTIFENRTCKFRSFRTAKHKMSVINISEREVKEFLDWPSTYEAVEQSLRAVCEIRVSDDQPNHVQPTRMFTPALNGKGKNKS